MIQLTLYVPRPSRTVKIFTVRRAALGRAVRRRPFSDSLAVFLQWTAEIPLKILMYDMGRSPFESMETDRGEKCASQMQRSAIYFANFDRVFVPSRCC